MGRGVALVGAGVSPFGIRSATWREMVAEAGKACFDSVPRLRPATIEGLVVGTVMPERTAFQSHLAPLAAETLGIKPRKLSARTEHMCASGTAGIRYAYAFIRAGLADVILAVGAEKLNVPVKGEAVLNMGSGVDREWEAAFGLTAPPAFALAAQAHQRKYGTPDEALSLISMKNRRNAARNPFAHFQEVPSYEEVACARIISSPLRLYHCSPITDGAAAVLLVTEDRVEEFTDRPVWIHGTGQAVDGFSLANLPDDYSRWPALRAAANDAYTMAGIGPEGVDVAEVHDCFAIAELIAYADLGFCPEGSEAEFIESRASDYGGQVVVNPRGGLIGCGHPLGATGVAQAAEIFWQLRGEAGARQVEGARIGLAHNNSGMGEHVIMIYGKERP